jgi:hypothetical protein
MSSAEVSEQFIAGQRARAAKATKAAQVAGAMGARETYQTSVNNAEAAKIASNVTNANTAQESINAVGVNIGANPALGVTAAHDATIRAANVTYREALLTAEKTKQATIQVANDVLRNTGDDIPPPPEAGQAIVSRCVCRQRGNERAAD